MAISNASELDAGVVSYCDRQDVRTVLLRVASDVADTTLAAWASTAEVDKFIDLYLEPTRLDLEAMACRDWGHHTDVEICISGNGTETLDLSQYGFWPLLGLSSLTINDDEQDLDDFVWSADGIIAPVYYYGGRVIFYRGNYNIDAVIDYGYETVPADVKVAHAELVALAILPILQAASTADPAGVPGVQRIQYQDIQITNYQQGRYAPTIKRLEAHVKSVVDRYRLPRIAMARPRVDEYLPGTRYAQFLDVDDDE